MKEEKGYIIEAKLPEGTVYKCKGGLTNIKNEASFYNNLETAYANQIKFEGIILKNNLTVNSSWIKTKFVVKRWIPFSDKYRYD